MLITPKTKIGELLEAYPSLEPVLIGMSPVFQKLKNPILRKTVARVATIQQISLVGNIPVGEIISRLRKEVGQADPEDTIDAANRTSSNPPSWFDVKKITIVFDASQIINSGESPMADILRKANQLHPDEILQLTTPFMPAPILDILESKGFQVYSVEGEQKVKSYIGKL